MTTLPKEINHTEQLSALPSNTQSLSVVVSPSNGSSFTVESGRVVQFDLGARGHLVPGSMYLRWKGAAVNAHATTVNYMLGTPAYTPFKNMEVIAGSSNIESILNYNQVCNLVVNTKMNYSQKVGMAAAFGLLDASTAPTNQNLNGRTIPANATDTFYTAAPVNCCLASAEKYFPLGMAPAMRLQFTLDAVENIFQLSTDISMTISDHELCYDIVDFGGEVDQLVGSMINADGNLIIKSQSYSVGSQTINTGAAGQQEYIFNQRISSIKALFANFSAATLSKTFGSRDITSGTGDYSFMVGQQQYPQRVLSAARNKAAMLVELMQCWGVSSSIETSNCSITPEQWNWLAGDADTAVIPAAFIVGCNTEKLSTNQNLLTGISSQLSPISVRINFGTYTTVATFVCTLIALHDVIIEINPLTRTVVTKK